MRWGRFLDYLGNPAPKAVFWLALTAVLVAVAAYVISSLRRTFRDRRPDASNLMTNFRELHSRGQLSDEEYRTIKASLAERLRRQLDTTQVDTKQPRLERSDQDTEGDD